jgi:hypothetical protein
MAQTNTTTRKISDGFVDGNNFVGAVSGCDSFSHPCQLKPDQVRWAINAVNKGAIWQTRPGYRTRLTFDLVNTTVFQAWWNEAGQPIIVPQMAVDFTPSNGLPQIVFAVSGSVWFVAVNHDGSFGVPVLITTVSFNQNADQITGTSCVQTATIFAGQYANNQVPTNLLIIQDGINRAGVWNGTTAYQANPQKRISVTPSGDTLYTDGFNETRIGLWCAWSGNRLWVHNGPNGYASDEGDPTHFTEELTFTSFQAFTYPSNVTGCIDRGISGTTNSALWVFTRNTSWAIASGVQGRIPTSTNVGWINTPNFQTQMFSNVGCVAGKSIIIHRGLLYWRSEDGIVVFDSTGTVYSTQNLPPIDQEETYSKRLVAPDAKMSCAGSREAYVFWSVPVGGVTSGRPQNGHTQVLDRQTTVIHTLGLNGPFTYGTIGWQGVWTGIRPVEWCSVEAGGYARTYALSMDQDGVVRIWEAFQGNRCDNGHEIPWAIETRSHLMANSFFETTNFQFFKLSMDQILGNLAVQGSWRGLRGVYHDLLNTSVTATPGSFLLGLPEFSPIVNDTPLQSFTVQSRDITSPNVMGPQPDCQATGVESYFADARDRAFSLFLQFKGRGALTAYRLCGNDPVENTEGRSVAPTGVDETGFNIVPDNDCPVHIPGDTPDYVAVAANPRDAFTPIIPVFDDSDLYQAPAA